MQVCRWLHISCATTTKKDVLEQFIKFSFASKNNVTAFVLELQEDFCQVIVKLKEK